MTISEQIKVLCVRSNISVAGTRKAHGDYAAKFQLKNETGKLYNLRFGISGGNSGVFF